MKHELEPSKNILRQFLSDLESVQKLCFSVDGPQIVAALSVKDCSPIFGYLKQKSLTNAKKELFGFALSKVFCSI